jgi:hypothetical protein
MAGSLTCRGFDAYPPRLQAFRFSILQTNGKQQMVSGQDTPEDNLADAEALDKVANQALLFGALSAKAVGADTFEDPVMHTYFLHYIVGAIEAIGQYESLGEGDRVNAMGRALMSFEGATREEVMSTLQMIYRAKDDAALRIREEGRRAAEAWDGGENRDPVFRFAELLKDRDANFPAEVEPSPPLTTPPGAH